MVREPETLQEELHRAACEFEKQFPCHNSGELFEHLEIVRAGRVEDEVRVPESLDEFDSDAKGAEIDKVIQAESLEERMDKAAGEYYEQFPRQSIDVYDDHIKIISGEFVEDKVRIPESLDVNDEFNDSQPLEVNDLCGASQSLEVNEDSNDSGSESVAVASDREEETRSKLDVDDRRTPGLPPFKKFRTFDVDQKMKDCDVKGGEIPESPDIESNDGFTGDCSPILSNKHYGLVIQRLVQAKKSYTDNIEKKIGLKTKVRYLLKNTDGCDSDEEAPNQLYYDDIIESKTTCPPDAEENDSHRKVGEDSKTPVCVCESQKMEAVWNNAIPVSFNSQLKQDEFKRRRSDFLGDCDDVMSSSEFVIGKHMKVTVFVSYKGAEVFNRVMMTICHGNNTILVDTETFFTRGVFRIDHGMYHFGDFLSDVYEIRIVDNLYAEFFKDEETQWIILRQYDHQKYCNHRLYISLESWLEIKRIIPLLKSISQQYRDTIMQGRAVKCAASGWVKDEIDPRGNAEGDTTPTSFKNKISSLSPMTPLKGDVPEKKE